MKRILFVGSEYYPFVKTGGLGDAIASLLRAVQISGNQATILLPSYRSITDKIVKTHETHDISIPFSVVIRARLKRVTLVGHNVAIWILDARQFFHQPGGIYEEQDGTEGHLNTLRFAMLAWVAAELACGSITNWAADIVHCHDWHAALVPVYIKKKQANSALGPSPKTLLTIHNLAFQGHCFLEYLGILGLEDFASAVTKPGKDMFSFLELGIEHADRVSTVSPTYAREILGEELGCGLDRQLAAHAHEIRGILNGVDYNVWHPQTDKALGLPGFRFDREARSGIKLKLQRRLGLVQAPDVPLLSFTNRLTHQKMADVFIALLPQLMRCKVQIVAMGEGQDEYVEAFTRLAGEYGAQFVYIDRFCEAMEHRIHAGADICLSPSRFEPCGLNPLYAMRYGSVPVVRATGGLCDTIVHADHRAIEAGLANGITFQSADICGLRQGIEEALALYEDQALWQKLQKNAMKASFLWQRAAREYCTIYDTMLQGVVLERAVEKFVQHKTNEPDFAPLLNVAGRV
jgi:starch synthase